MLWLALDGGLCGSLAIVLRMLMRPCVWCLLDVVRASTEETFDGFSGIIVCLLLLTAGKRLGSWQVPESKTQTHLSWWSDGGPLFLEALPLCPFLNIRRESISVAQATRGRRSVGRRILYHEMFLNLTRLRQEEARTRETRSPG